LEFTLINQEKDIQILKALNVIQNNQNEFERTTDTHKGISKENVTIPKLKCVEITVLERSIYNKPCTQILVLKSFIHCFVQNQPLIHRQLLNQRPISN